MNPLEKEKKIREAEEELETLRLKLHKLFDIDRMWDRHEESIEKISKKYGKEDAEALYVTPEAREKEKQKNKKATNTEEINND